ncbi:recombinase family protein [Streptomyces buecherae]|uniref:Recombinase family protein n=2 Tax=Streptomyces buecherae TaxID=2763006 RepID=A0A7H8NKE4_9ACTN|nr:recombinase family protein [Streptomyces buecherae]
MPALTEVRIGYTRLSIGGQKLDRQLDGLTITGCRHISTEKNDLRPEQKACHAVPPQPCGILVAPVLDRYGRSLKDLVHMVGDLRIGETGFTFPQRLDTTAVGGHLADTDVTNCGFLTAKWSTRDGRARLPDVPMSHTVHSNRDPPPGRGPDAPTR